MLKIDIINDAYSQLRISGITTAPAPEELELALFRLESMMDELFARNICVNYNFEDEPDLNSKTNVERFAKQMMATNLALRLSQDFNKSPNPSLIAAASSSLSTVSGVAARNLMESVNYPGRQPIGSGNSRYGGRWRRFYPAYQEAPANCDTNEILIGEINDYVERFGPWLKAEESIDSYTISAESGLIIESSSVSGENIDYRVKAAGVGDSVNGFSCVKIVVTSTVGRVDNRVINFKIG
tara:strand:+ start:9842 stop:10561 length:720 start_codon:yes stop_codon:yes gene_type:complete